MNETIQDATEKNQREKDNVKLFGVKHDEGKAKVSLIPPGPLVEIAKVFGYGAEKYSRNNFKKGMAWSRLYDAMMRHMLAWLGGEELDPESGFPHLSHAGCCLLMLQDATIHGYGQDDRYKEPECSTGSK